MDRPEDASELDASAMGTRYCLPPCGPEISVSCGGVEDEPEGRLCTAAGRESEADARARLRAGTSDPGVTCVDADLDGVCDDESAAECNGADEDCDGTADDAYVPVATTVDDSDITIPVLAEDFTFPISESGTCTVFGTLEGALTCEMGAVVPSVQRDADFCGMVTQRWADPGTPPMSWEAEMAQLSSVPDADGSSRNCAGYGDLNASAYEEFSRIFCDGTYSGGAWPGGADMTISGSRWDPEGIGPGDPKPHAMCPPHMRCTGQANPPFGSGETARLFCQPIPNCAICWQPVVDGNPDTPPWPPSNGTCS